MPNIFLHLLTKHILWFASIATCRTRAPVNAKEELKAYRYVQMFIHHNRLGFKLFLLFIWITLKCVFVCVFLFTEIETDTGKNNKNLITQSLFVSYVNDNLKWTNARWKVKKKTKINRSLLTVAICFYSFQFPLKRVRWTFFSLSFRPTIFNSFTKVFFK